MPTPLVELDRAWREHPEGRNRASGGRRALGGFTYQIHLSLLHFFRATINGDTSAAFAFEALSDIAREQGGLIYLTQVKSSLSKAALRSAVAEALAVDRFLADAFPAHQESFRYQIACRRRPASLPETSSLTSHDLNLGVEDAKRWSGLRRRFLPTSVQSDPLLELAILLFPNTNEVFNFIGSAVGTTLALLGEGREGTDVARELLQMWDKARNDATHPGKILSVQDWLSIDEELPLLVGERPTVTEVASGAFMDRTSRIHAIVDEVYEILTRPRTNGLPILWLEGTSGTGKSILLLQVLRELTLQGVGPIHWLQHFSWQLPGALEAWKDQSIRAIIAVDDLYSPEHRKSSATWQRVIELASTGHWPSGPPLILTTGPHEYLDSFESEINRSGHAGIRKIEVKPLDIGEREDFRFWYSRRTEWEAPRLTESNFVSAAFLFELQRSQNSRDLRQFATRFTDRLSELGILEATYSALALNRFGMLAPEELFSSEPDAIEQLRREKIVRLHRTESGTGLRLFHPQIANTLYTTLRPPLKKATHARDLAVAVAATLPDQVRAVEVLAFFAPRERRDRLGPETWAWFAREVWEQIAKMQPSEVPLILLISLLKSYHEALDGYAHRIAARLQQWLDNAQLNDEDWMVLFQLLDQVKPADVGEKRLARARLLLIRYADSPAWSYVWQILWRRQPSEELASLATEWMRDNSHTRAWGYVFQPLYNFDSSFAPLTRLSREGLKRSPVSIADPHLWTKARTLLKQEELAALVISRASRSGDTRLQEKAVDFVFRTLDVRGEALSVALSSGQTEANYSFFLQKALRDWVPVELQNAARAWLDSNADHPAWNYVWQRLISLDSRDFTLRDAGRHWLVGREHRPDWSHVWRRLFDLAPHDRDLRSRGREWLQYNEDRPDWNVVWQRLYEADYADLELFDVGWRWLEGRDDHPGWNYVWQRLFLSGIKRISVIELGRDWIVGHQDAPSWSHVWERLTEADSEDSHLALLGLNWLDEHKDRPDWAYVWRRLLLLFIDEHDLQLIGLDWLQGGEDTATDNYTNPGWTYVWESLVNFKGVTPPLRDMGGRWISRNLNHPRRTFVERVLASSGRPALNSE